MNPKVITLPDCPVVVQGVHCQYYMCVTFVLNDFQGLTCLQYKVITACFSIVRLTTLDFPILLGTALKQTVFDCGKYCK